MIYGGVDVMPDILDSMLRFREVLPSRAVPIINVCVSSLNLDELPALVEFASQRQFHCSFVPVALAESKGDGDGFAAHAPEMALSPDEKEHAVEVYDHLIRLKRRGAPIANSTRFLRDSAQYLRDGSYPWSCDAGLLYISVSPEGDVSICHRYPPFARWDETNLAGRMASSENRRLFRGQREVCEGCMRPCWAEVSHVFRSPASGLEALATMRPWRHLTGGR